MTGLGGHRDVRAAPDAECADPVRPADGRGRDDSRRFDHRLDRHAWAATWSTRSESQALAGWAIKRLFTELAVGGHLPRNRHLVMTVGRS